MNPTESTLLCTHLTMLKAEIVDILLIYIGFGLLLWIISLFIATFIQAVTSIYMCCTQLLSRKNFRDLNRYDSDDSSDDEQNRRLSNQNEHKEKKLNKRK